MVTNHGGRRTMPTGDAGSPIGGRSSGNAGGGRDGAVDGPPVAQGGAGC